MNHVLVVAFAPMPHHVASPGHQAVEVLARERWSPPGARWTPLITPALWWGAAEAIEAAAQDADAIVLLGARGAKKKARIARFAHNEVKPGAQDARGYDYPGAAVAPRAPAFLAPMLDADRLALAMNMAGLPAKAAARGGRGVLNHIFFNVLWRAPARPTALIRLPLSVESARAAGLQGHVNRLENLFGVASAITFMAATAEAGAQRPPSGQTGSESLCPVNGNP